MLKDIATSRSWTERKTLIGHTDLSREVMGQSFFCCLPVVAAEHLLAILKSEMQKMIQPAQSTFDAPSIRGLRDEYMEIVAHFKEAKPGLDLDAAYYKFAVYVDH